MGTVPDLASAVLVLFRAADAGRRSDCDLAVLGLAHLPGKRPDFHQGHGREVARQVERQRHDS